MCKDPEQKQKKRVKGTTPKGIIGQRAEILDEALDAELKFRAAIQEGDGLKARRHLRKLRRLAGRSAELAKLEEHCPEESDDLL